jgi:hypothetical protein
MGPEAGIAVLASLAVGDAWLFLSASGSFVEQNARAHGRLKLRLPAQSSPSTSSSGAPDEPRNRAVLLIALAVTHPNRATKIIPLFSGKRAR